jgi:hypothetical protein
MTDKKEKPRFRDQEQAFEARKLIDLLDVEAREEIEGLRHALRIFQVNPWNIPKVLERITDPGLKIFIENLVMRENVLSNAVQHVLDVLGSAALPLASLGKRFEQGPKKDRLDALSKLIIKSWGAWVRTMGTKPTTRNVFDMLNLDKDEDDKIYWKPHRTKEEKNCTYKTFEARMTILRKKGLLPFPLD